MIRKARSARQIYLVQSALGRLQSLTDGGQKQPLRAGQKRASDKTPIRLKYDPKRRTAHRYDQGAAVSCQVQGAGQCQHNHLSHRVRRLWATTWIAQHRLLIAMSYI